MKFLVSLVVFFLVLNDFISAQTLIQDSCKLAASRDPTFKYDFCVNSLTQDPQSKTATSVAGLVLASTKNAAIKTMYMRGLAQQMLKDKRFQGMQDALHGCIGIYGDASGSLNHALASFKAQDYKTGGYDVSAALDAPQICEGGFKQETPLTKENSVLFQKIFIPLIFSSWLKT